MTSHQTVLVLGASGGIGGEVARRLLARGWTVRALNRDPGRLPAADKACGIGWIAGDALSATDVAKAAEGASVVVHAVNPPGYRNWKTQVLPMLDNTIAAARAAGARIVLPGTVYNFGPDAFPELRENSPQHPVTVKGKIRVEMERRLRGAADAGTPVLILRAGDFFGPRMSGNSWFSSGLVTPGKPVTAITYPGRRGVGHGRPVGRGRHRDDRGDPQGERKSGRPGAGISLAPGAPAVARRAAVPRDFGDALSLDHPGPYG